SALRTLVPWGPFAVWVPPSGPTTGQAGPPAAAPVTGPNSTAMVLGGRGISGGRSPPRSGEGAGSPASKRSERALTWTVWAQATCGIAAQAARNTAGMIDSLRRPCGDSIGARGATAAARTDATPDSGDR